MLCIADFHIKTKQFPRRRSSPSYGFTIMNRLSIENLSEKITPSMNVHMNSPFVLYQSKNGSERPRGIWFYSQYDCSRIHTLIQRLQKETVPAPGTYTQT